MNSTKTQGSDVLPIGIINAAAQGDPCAIRAVVRHYEGYITALSVVRLYAEDGTPYTFIDEALRRELELRLITKVVGFKYKPA
jgi:hypothetical protein